MWLGISHQTIEEFSAYTHGLEDSRSGCPAFKDFGVSFIDTDFFVAYRTTNGEVLPAEELADEVDTNSLETLNSIVAAAKNKGITHGNALYYYVNAKFTEENPGILYNDLTFIGSFDDPE